MATGVAPVSVSGYVGGSSLNRLSIQRKELLAARSPSLGKPLRLTIERKSSHKLTAIRAAHDDDGRGGGSDFLAGFLLGGAVFGTLAYTLAPKIRRAIRHENEHGFVQGRPPLYYQQYADPDDPLVKAKQTLNSKLGQLNDAIDNVSRRVRGKKRRPVEMVTDDEEILGIGA